MAPSRPLAIGQSNVLHSIFSLVSYRAFSTLVMEQQQEFGCRQSVVGNGQKSYSKALDGVFYHSNFVIARGLAHPQIPEGKKRAYIAWGITLRLSSCRDVPHQLSWRLLSNTYMLCTILRTMGWRALHHEGRSSQHSRILQYCAFN